MTQFPSPPPTWDEFRIIRFNNVFPQILEILLHKKWSGHYDVQCACCKGREILWISRVWKFTADKNGWVLLRTTTTIIFWIFTVFVLYMNNIRLQFAVKTLKIRETEHILEPINNRFIFHRRNQNFTVKCCCCQSSPKSFETISKITLQISVQLYSVFFLCCSCCGVTLLSFFC